jgi:hypothetical protein
MKLLKTNLCNQRISLSLLIFLLGIISCQEIPDASQVLDGQRTYQGVNYGVERFGKFEFYLVPEIQL